MQDRAKKIALPIFTIIGIVIGFGISKIDNKIGIFSPKNTTTFNNINNKPLKELITTEQHIVSDVVQAPVPELVSTSKTDLVKPENRFSRDMQINLENYNILLENIKSEIKRISQYGEPDNAPTKSVERLNIKTRHSSDNFFLEPRVLLFSNKSAGYQSGQSGDWVYGKLFYDTTEKKFVTITRGQLLGEEIGAFFDSNPLEKPLKINVIFGRIPGDSHVFYLEDIYIVTGFEEIDS